MLNILLWFGEYIAWLKHVNSKRSNSVRFDSNVAFFKGDCAKPTPFSQMYSQLSTACRSSALSYKNINIVINLNIIGLKK